MGERRRLATRVALVAAGLLTAVGQAGADPRPGTRARRASTVGRRPAPTPPADEGPDDAAPEPREEVDPLETPMPTRWLPSLGRQCHVYKRVRVCDGPRRVPEPFGPAAELASRLGLGTRPAASELLRSPPRPEWLEAIEGEAPDRLRWPVDDGRFGRGFGRMRHRGRMRFHKGLDIVAPEGSAIRAVADGVVAYADTRLRGYGNVAIVIHADGSTSLYSHCRAIYLFPGQQVRTGQLLGEVGHTGNALGPHLHFELRREGQLENPMAAFDQRQGEADEEAAEGDETPSAIGRSRPRRRRAS